MKCPKCDYEFDEEIEDLKPMFRSAVRVIDREWQVAQEQLELALLQSEIKNAS